MDYKILIGIWIFFLAVEYFFPREKNIFWKKSLFLDIVFVSINAFFFWMIELNIYDTIEKFLCFETHFIRISEWNIWGQTLLLFFLFDFFRWWTHRALHFFSWGWKIHKTHHTLEKLHFLRVLYYNPLENIIYIITTLPILLLFHFDWKILLFLGIIDAIIGYSNHANISLRVPKFLAKIINTPQVHIWHHDESSKANITGYGKNFGINLSLWDWIFGTLYMSEKNPKKIGNPQDRNFVEKKFE